MLKKSVLANVVSRAFLFAVVSTSFVAVTTLTACDKDNQRTVAAQVQTSTIIQGKTMGTFYAVNVVGGYKGGEAGLKALAEGAREAGLKF